MPALVQQPAHLAVAVQALEVVARAVEDGGHPVERPTVGGVQVQVGLAQHGQRIGPQSGHQALLGHVAVVAEHLRLGPRGAGVDCVEDRSHT